MFTHRRPSARTGATFGLVIALAIVGAFLVACNDDGGPTSSTINPPAPTAIVTTPASSPPTAAADTDSSQACEIDISRAKSLQSISVAGSTVTGTVYASEKSGKPLYARIWYNERHQTKVGDFEVNEPFSFELPSPGDYRLVIDVEYDGDGDGNADCQRDGLNKTVTVKTPPPEGCSVRLRCEEPRAEEEINASEGLTKHLSCNVPGTWSHDADEAETSPSSFWGYWQSRANPRTASTTFTAKADRRCTESWEWPVPADPCANARLDVTYAFHDNDTGFITARVTISQTSAPALINWGDGASTQNVGQGAVVEHRYRRTAQRQVFTIRVSNDCLEDRATAVIEPLTCDELNPPAYSGTGDVTQEGDRVFVRLDAELQNGEYNLEVFWKNGIFSRVKKEKTFTVECEQGQRSVSIEWDSSSRTHRPSRGADYRFRINPIDGGALPTIGCWVTSNSGGTCVLQ